VRTLEILLAIAPLVLGQRAFEDRGEIVYQDASGTRTNVGQGFSPVLTSAGDVVFVRGRKFEYGDDFDCKDRAKKNWIALWDPQTRRQSVLFDRPIELQKKWTFCIYDQVEISPDSAKLYLVIPAYAASRSLAVVELKTGQILDEPGVAAAYVIRTGSHRGELVEYRRLWQPGSEGPSYSWVLADTRGRTKKILHVDEWVGDHAPQEKSMPGLAKYLRSIDAQIVVHGTLFP
jgi:hypothetical protein